MGVIRRELQEAIAAAAADDQAPWLVFADWLMERGDPRGELISLCCALERMPASDPQRQELEARVEALKEASTAPLEERFKAWDLRWRRGMVEHLTLDAEPLLEHEEQLFERCPLLTSVRVQEVDDRLPRLLERPWIGGLRALDLSSCYLGDQVAHLVATAECLHRLESLELGGNGISDDGVAALAGSPHLSNLVYLGLNTNAVEDDGAVALGESRTLTSLRRLDLSEINLGKMWDDNDIRQRGGVAVAKLPLTHLDLSGNSVDDATLETLAAATGPVLPVELGFYKTGAGDRGIAALAGSPRSRELRVLNLCNNPFTDEAGRALLDSPYLRSDVKLGLRQRVHWRRLTPGTIEGLRARFENLDLNE